MNLGFEALRQLASCRQQRMSSSSARLLRESYGYPLTQSADSPH